MTTAKICGLRTPEAVAAALDGGASHVGFMFFPASPRDIAPEAAAALARPARGRASLVAVVVDPDDALLKRIMTVLAPDAIQLHGRETPARAGDIAQRTGASVIKVVPVSDASDIDAAARYEGVVDHLMFEARPPPGSDRPGGLGATFDWTLMAGRRFERPWFLAGGLDPWNVGAAIAASGAPIVDVSSGVERGAGLKDPALIAAFLDAVRRA
jgi:phosphoribosylanthranilate isomerase